MKIKNLYVHSFRGIPKEVTLSFENKTGKAMSSIIYGDNGSGKSSIIDAIEFCLQGRIERSQVLRNPKRPSPLSYASKFLCGAKAIVEFDNKNICERSIELRHRAGNTIVYMDNRAMDSSFSVVPLVLRRNDIISFNIIPSDKRQVLFFSFLYQDRSNAKQVLDSECFTEDDPLILQLREEYTEKKHERAELVEKLSLILKVDKQIIPFGYVNKLNDFFSSSFCVKNGKTSTKKGTPKKVISQIKYDAAKGIIDNINQITLRISDIKNSIEAYLNPNKEGLRDRKKANKLFLEEASRYLLESYREISNADYVRSIKLTVGSWTTASLDIEVQLINGKKVSPNNIFSEANYDLMILLLYVSIIRVGANHGQAKILILDDVLQSVDSTIRSSFLEYLLREFKDWQIILTAHDRLWMEQAKTIFQRNNHPLKLIRVFDWEFTNGPKIRYEDHRVYDNVLEKAIEMDDNIYMASMSGQIIELMCNKLSYSLSLGIERKYDDKYTIGDLWPSLKSKLKKTTLHHEIEEIDKLLSIRNLLGCHYNEWARSLSDDEVKRFAINVQTLYDKTFCRNCCTWIKYINSNGIIAECSCHKIQYLKE